MSSSSSSSSTGESSYRRGGGDGRKVWSAEDREQFLQQRREQEQALEAKFGYANVAAGGRDDGLAVGGAAKIGWLLNMQPTTIVDAETKQQRSAVDLYFIEESGATFKVTVARSPYFYAMVAKSRLREGEDALRSAYGEQLLSVDVVQKEDLDMPNHLVGRATNSVLKLSFRTVADLVAVKKDLLPRVARNKARLQVDKRYRYLARLDASASSSSSSSHDVLARASVAVASRAFDDNDDDDDNNNNTSNASGDGSKAADDAYDDGDGDADGRNGGLSVIEDVREYDVPYYQRVAIDSGLRVAKWYSVRLVAGAAASAQLSDLCVSGPCGLGASVEVAVCVLTEREIFPDLKVLAFDIECTKQELRFPDAEFDSIFMISYMIDQQGYLIINRQVVSQDIDDFEYTPRSEFPGHFIVFNEPDEYQLLVRFFQHVQDERPHVFVTFNGDGFDWPFVAKRAQLHRLDLYANIGLYTPAPSPDGTPGEMACRWASNMDAFRWVMRDSYLPQGSQGLKAVTKAKLGYDPIEIDPEEMVALAQQDPQRMAAYSVSDAVATYYLYMKYVHPFIYSLCTILPMNPDDVLRKGSGTLCEALLMVEAYSANIIYPNKQDSGGRHKFTHHGHLLESETYIGGHVEALESGVFRKDLTYRFRLAPDTFQMLIDQVDDVIHFAVVHDAKKDVADVVNLAAVRQQIVERLERLRDQPDIEETPLLYHLDVAAMYPNIILTNRLQPSAIVSQAACAACDYNSPANNCQRRMKWTWRGDYIPATRQEYDLIRSRLETQRFSVKERQAHQDEAAAEQRKRKWNKGRFNQRAAATASARRSGPQSTGVDDDEAVPFHRLTQHEQQQIIKKRLKEYSKRAYNRTHVETEEERLATVCMREHPFYVNTVRNFRDRRYTYKDLLKRAQGEQSQARARSDLDALSQASKRVVLYDSLQLAHKCILNSFYGYVMRRGARWFSMEMAGIVTHTGSAIIKKTRELIERVGRPLELDTDGIWCMLPQTFPENFRLEFRNRGGSSFVLSYPCQALNYLTHQHFTNHQYQERVGVSDRFTTRSECSIFFEVDGPYRAMVFPAAKEEGKKLKKRYAVFHNDGSIAELKGFELKRRGELKMIKIFQAEVFAHFLGGSTLVECYQEVAKVANHWLDIIDHQGASADEAELLDWLSCSANMSRRLEDYGAQQKSAALATARRLAEFLGAQMVKNKGLSCTYIISNTPSGAPVTERAVPVAIFHTDQQVRQHYLRRWCKIRPGAPDADYSVRSLLDWSYYRERLASVIQKIITIPAAMQGLDNPVPRVDHPDWLQRRLSTAKQTKLVKFWQPVDDADREASALADLEDFGRPPASATKTATVTRVASTGKRPRAVRASSFLTAPISSPKEALAKHVLSDACGYLDLGHGDPGDEPGAEQLAGFDPSLVRVVMRTPLPDPGVDHARWLRWLKCKWNLQRAQRQLMSFDRLGGSTTPSSADSLDADNADDQETGGGAVKRPRVQQQQQQQLSIHELLRRQRQAVLSGTWQVLEIAETPTPGTLRLWVLINSTNLLSLLVTVPREFYINTSETCLDETDERFTRVERTLPRSRPVDNLYKVSMDEEVYQASQKELLGIFAQPQVHDVYETQTSLLYHATLRLGAVCRLSAAARQKHSGIAAAAAAGGRSQFHIDDLEIRPQAVAARYLAAEVACYSRLFVYIAEAAATRACVAVFEPTTSTTEPCYVVNVLLTHSAPDPTERAFARLVKQELQRQRGALDDNDESVCIVDVRVRRVAGTVGELFAAADRLLADYLSGGVHAQQPSICAVQAHLPRAALVDRLPRLAELPLMCLDGNAADNLFPMFGWDVFLARNLAFRFYDFLPWFADQLRCARYANVPVCNLECDYSVYVTDVLFGRLLREANHLLWVSESSKPDVGHIAEDDHALAEELFPVSIGRPGCFDRVCVELTVRSLAMNSIMQSAELHSAEGSSEALLMMSTVKTADGGYGDTLDDTNAPWVPFKVLRVLIAQWARDFDSEPALVRTLIDHLYRWLSSPQSRLYDSALHRMVFRAMKKVFVQVLSELESLGSEVVFANFNKIIVKTSKESVPQARAYWEFIAETIQSQTLFLYLDLLPDHFWDVFVFLDSSNYGALISNSSSSSSSSVDDAEDTEIIAHWNAAEYLPDVVEKNFLVLVGEFLLGLFQTKQRQLRNKQQDGKKSSKGFTLRLDQQRVFALVESIAQSVSFADEGSHRRMPGAGSLRGTPALAFVNLLCHVFALYPPAAGQVLVLRRNLLRLLRVREFSPEAQFANPCPTYLLADVICSFCSVVRDLDLLRDAHILANNWNCLRCSQPLNKDAIELRLVDVLQRRVAAYQVQDLRCRKCQRVKEDFLSTMCPFCFTAYEPTQPREHVRDMLKTLRLVVDYHGFAYLGELVTYCQDGLE